MPEENRHGVCTCARVLHLVVCRFIFTSDWCHPGKNGLMRHPVCSAFHDRFYPELLLLHEEHKGLIKVGVEVAHLDGGLLLLAYPLTLPVQQLYLHVGI